MDEGIRKVIQLPHSSLRKIKLLSMGGTLKLSFSLLNYMRNQVHKQSYIVITCLFKP